MDFITDSDMKMLEKAGEAIASRVKQAASVKHAQEFWENLDPNHQAAVRNALIGAGVGAAGLGGMSAMSGEGTGNALKNALIGALSGAAVGGGGTIAKDYLTGQSRLPSEIQALESRPWYDTASDKALEAGINNVGALGGGTLGLYGAHKGMRGGIPGAIKQMTANRKDPESVRTLLATQGSAPENILAELDEAIKRLRSGKRLKVAPAQMVSPDGLKKLLRQGNVPRRGAGLLGALGLAGVGAGIGHLGQRYMEGENQ
jgi:hypothetical protein